MQLLSDNPRIVDERFADSGDVEELTHRAGQGAWKPFRALGLSISYVLESAAAWAPLFSGIEYPWLCWNVDEDWCFVQQQLVRSVGWTPIIGFDPRVGPPRKRVPEAILIDFNKDLRLPVLYPIFPVEFAFQFCDRLAFWHSDLLIRPTKMSKLAELFGKLRNGQTAAPFDSTGLRKLLSSKEKRYWELVACTTRAASRDQFEKGCSWWRTFWLHPNWRGDDRAAQRFYWDNGAGIYYWAKRGGGECVTLNVRDYEEGHFTKIGNSGYRGQFRTGSVGGRSDSQRAMSRELTDNFSLEGGCSKLGIHELWRATQNYDPS